MAMRTILFVSFVSVMSLVATSAMANQRISFTPFPSGLLAKQVKDIWKKAPENAEYVQLFEQAPDFMMGVYDLNDDGLPEVFARHSDELQQTCQQGPDAWGCLMIVYANTKNGLIEIGRMNAGGEVIAGSNKNQGVRDVLVRERDGSLTTYSWNGRTLVKQ